MVRGTCCLHTCTNFGHGAARTASWKCVARRATSELRLFAACSRTARAQVRYALSTECAARIDTQ